jgi:hypothetical protein
MSQQNLPTSNHQENEYHKSSKLREHNQFEGASSAAYADSSTRSRPLGIPGCASRIQLPEMRDFVGLHAERLYLLNCLQHENKKATDILRETLVLEEVLMFSTASPGRREAKKKLVWLGFRIKETNHQEQAILARLGQLSFEIQCRDRVMQVEAEQHLNSRYSEPSHRKQSTHLYAARDMSKTGTCSMASIQQQNCETGDCRCPSLTPDGDIDVTTKHHTEICNTVVSESLILQPNITENGPSERLLKIPRSSSMDSVELSITGSGSSFPSVPRTKRNSL